MWEEILSLTLSTNWQLSPFTEATAFKIKHILNSYSDAVAIVALVNDSISPVEIFQPQKIIPRQEAEVIKFTKIFGWKYKLAVKQVQLPNKPLAKWSIQAFASNAQEIDYFNIDYFNKGSITNLKLQSQFDNSKKLLLISCL